MTIKGKESNKRFRHQEKKRKRNLERKLLEKNLQEPQERPLGVKYLRKYKERYGEILGELDPSEIEAFRRTHNKTNPSKQDYDNLTRKYWEIFD